MILVMFSKIEVVFVMRNGGFGGMGSYGSEGRRMLAWLTCRAASGGE